MSEKKKKSIERRRRRINGRVGVETDTLSSHWVVGSFDLTVRAVRRREIENRIVLLKLAAATSAASQHLRLAVDVFTLCVWKSSAVASPSGRRSRKYGH